MSEKIEIGGLKNEVKAVNLAGMAEYQEGSVVSREVLRKPTGTVTVFAFAQGQGLSEHTAPFDAMVQVLDGDEAEVIVSGKTYMLKAGDIIIAVDGKTVKSFNALRGKIGSIGAGKKVDLTILRGGDEKTVTVTLKSAPDSQIAAANLHPMLDGAKFSNSDNNKGVNFFIF